MVYMLYFRLTSQAVVDCLRTVCPDKAKQKPRTVITQQNKGSYASNMAYMTNISK